MKASIDALVDDIVSARNLVASGPEPGAELEVLQALAYRGHKLQRAWARPQCLGFFGPSQAGKSFLVGALLSHELGTLKVVCRQGQVDFLQEINPAKGVESTGVVTRFSTHPAPQPLARGDFSCRLLELPVVLESLATGFLVECTAPTVDPSRVDACLRDARLETGPLAAPRLREAWDDVWHNLSKKYQNRHPYLSALKSHPTLKREDWKDTITTAAGWQLIYSLLLGGRGHAPDLDDLMRQLLDGLERVGHALDVEVELAHVRADADGTSLIDAACLNRLGRTGKMVVVYDAAAGREVAIDPGALAALIAEIRLPLKRAEGSLLDHADLLDFPGGRALKGINGFGPEELSTGSLDNAIEVYKRGKLTFLFEQFALDREITALVLCSPGPTKPEAIQLQSQVDRWLQIRHGAPAPTTREEIEHPSLFMALTKFDMSLGALRSDNAVERWEARVGEACVDFWARNAGSWIDNWGAKGRAFDNTYWICNPYADQMRTLRTSDPDYQTVKEGYFKSPAVQRYIKDAAVKWQAMEGDEPEGLPTSGIPLLASALESKLKEDIKARELLAEARSLHRELVGILKDLTPSRDEDEAQKRLLDNAEALVNAVRAEMAHHYSGAVFGVFIDHLVLPVEDVEQEVRAVWSRVAPMSIKTSDKVKKVLVHVLKWWVQSASARFRDAPLELPLSNVERFVRAVCMSKLIMPVLGRAVFSYFSRKEIDFGLVATILRVKISDAMIGLFAERQRRPVQHPLRLSYAEDAQAGAEASAEVDWGDVDFDDEPAEAPTDKIEIVFAGSRHFQGWSGMLGEFYVKAAGGRVNAPLSDPRMIEFAALLGHAEGLQLPGE